MATYSQDSQRLVLVAGNATPFVADTSAVDIDALDLGQIGLYNPDGTGFDSAAATAKPFIVAMGTKKSPVGNTIGATKDLSLVSETIHPGMGEYAIVRPGTDATLQTTTLDVGTAIPNNEYYITLDFDEYGSSSVQNTVQVYAVYVSTAADTATTIAAGLVANFNKNVQRTGVARATAANVAGVITFTAQEQGTVDFNNPWHPVSFFTSMNGSFAADAVLTEKVSVSTKGIGVGKEVVNIEHFAQGSEANWTWLKYPEMYARDLYANAANRYDINSMRLATTKTGFGSNITSKRQVEIYTANAVSGTVTAAAAGALNTALKALMGL